MSSLEVPFAVELLTLSNELLGEIIEIGSPMLLSVALRVLSVVVLVGSGIFGDWLVILVLLELPSLLGTLISRTGELLSLSSLAPFALGVSSPLTVKPESVLTLLSIWLPFV